MNNPNPAPPRERLSDRRMTVTTVVHWADRPWLLGVGFYADATAGEIFLNGVKAGTQLEGLVNDGCVLMSLLMQAGWRAADLAEILGGNTEDPASLFGLVLRQVAAIESEAAEGISAAVAAVDARQAAEPA